MTTLWEVISRFASLFVWWVIVAPWEAAIRVRFGRWPVILGPGVHFRIPHFDAVYRQTIRMRVAPVPMQTLATKDGATVSLCATVRFCVNDIALLYDTLHHPDETIRNLVAGEIARIVRSKTVADLSPDVIEKEVEEELDLSDFGLGDVEVTLVDFAVVRAIRLLQDQRWHTSDGLDTERETGARERQPYAIE